MNSSPISAFGYALYTDATQKITAAKSGQKIIIPAYSTVDTSLDWYGYVKMAELYGMN